MPGRGLFRRSGERPLPRQRDEPQQEAGFRTMGVLRSREGPLIRATAQGPSARGSRLSHRLRRLGGNALTGSAWIRRQLLRESGAISDRGRGRGDGERPSASQSIHFPNLLFCSAVAPGDWPGDARRVPGKRFGDRNKTTPGMQQMTTEFIKFFEVLSWNVFTGPSGRSPASFYPIPRCRPWRSPGQSGGPRGDRVRATGR